jgi:DNA-directed RNA polymerase subunit M/transcription elongation factor TFIIS
MAHLISCPECAKHLQVPEDLIGSKVQCPECQHTFTAELGGEREREKPQPPTDADESDRGEKRSTRAGASKKTHQRGYDDVDDDEDDFDVRRHARSGRRSNGADKPGKVQGMGIMALIGGIFAILIAITLAATCFGLLWPGTYYSLVVGILAVVKGSALLGGNAQTSTPPTGIAVMMIINIINGD